MTCNGCSILVNRLQIGGVKNHISKPFLETESGLLEGRFAEQDKAEYKRNNSAVGDRFQNLQREAEIEDSIHVEFFRKGMRDKWMELELKRRDSFKNPIITVQRVINEAIFIETMFKKDENSTLEPKKQVSTKILLQYAWV